MAQRSKQEVLDYLERAEVAAVGTSNMGSPRQRMMHFAAGVIAGLFYTNAKGKFSFINMAPGVAEFLIATTYGVFMTMGAYYVQTGHHSVQALLISLPVALFISNVLLINQFPGAESDAKSNKNTLVVRLGKRKAKNVLIGGFVAGYAIIALLPLIHYAPYTLCFAFLSIPFAVHA